MEFSKYTFEVLVHDVATMKPTTILAPRVSISICGLAKVLIEANSSIGFQSAIRPFSHGKKLLLALSPGQLENVIEQEPLEVLLLDDDRILAGARISLKALLPLDVKFKRGQFHLFNQLNSPFALLDLSLRAQTGHAKSKHPPPPQKQPIASDPIPDPIVYRGKKKQAEKQTISRKPPQLPQKKPPQPAIQRPPIAIKQEQQSETGAQAQLSISALVTGYHCPAPIVFRQEPFKQQPPSLEQQLIAPRAGSAPAARKMASTSVQTEAEVIVKKKQDDTKVELPLHSQEVTEEEQQQRQKTGQTEESYPEDFESVGQSQNLSKRAMTENPNRVSPGPIKRTKSIQPSEYVEEEISDIYSEDFESMSQSLRKSGSLQSRHKRSQPDASESYVPDFESVSQSASHIQQSGSYRR